MTAGVPPPLAIVTVAACLLFSPLFVSVHGGILGSCTKGTAARNPPLSTFVLFSAWDGSLDSGKKEASTLIFKTPDLPCGGIFQKIALFQSFQIHHRVIATRSN